MRQVDTVCTHSWTHGSVIQVCDRGGLVGIGDGRGLRRFRRGQCGRNMRVESEQPFQEVEGRRHPEAELMAPMACFQQQGLLQSCHCCCPHLPSLHHPDSPSHCQLYSSLETYHSGEQSQQD